MQPPSTAFAVFTVFCAFLASGCIPTAAPPDSLDVALSATLKSTAARDSGPAVLADTTWAAYRKPDAPGSATISPYGASLGGPSILTRPEPDTVMLRVRFGPSGVAELLFDNAFYAPQIFGPQIIIDGQPHATITPFLTYATNSYGLSDGDRFGFAAPIEVWLGGLPVGTGLAYVWGTRTGDRIDGTFGYQVDVTLPNTPFGNGGADQYPFYALLEAP